MATKKITELTAVPTPTGADVFPIVQGGVTYKATRAQNASKGADIASAATTDIGAATGEYVEVTGTVTITALGTVAAGTRRLVRFTGALILTHNAASLIMPNAENVTTVADDIVEFISLGSGNWICSSYPRIAASATGKGIVELATNAEALAGTDTTRAITADSLEHVIENRAHGLLSITAAGTDTYTGTLSPVPAAYVSGMLYLAKFTNANTSAAPTLNLNSLGAKTIKKEGGVALSLIDIPAGHYALLQYNGTDMILLNPAIPSKFLSTTAAGTNTYTATLSPAIAAYESGMHYFITFTNANTAGSTLNLNALGAKTIKTAGGFVLRVNSIQAGHVGILKYDGTDMILLNPVMTKPSFSVHKGGTDQTGINTSPTLITWPTELFDAHALFASNRWTPGILGKYILSSTVLCTTAADTGTGYLQIWKNGALLHKGPKAHAAGTGAIGLEVTAVVSVDVSTDYFEIYIEQGFVNPITVSGTATETYFTGAIID